MIFFISQKRFCLFRLLNLNLLVSEFIDSLLIPARVVLWGKSENEGKDVKTT